MKKTYLSVLSTDDYLPGVLVLYESLKKTGTTIPLTVMVTKAVSKDTETKLIEQGIAVIRKDESILLSEKQQKQNEDVGYRYWNYTFDSLYVFELTQFEKIVYLDCDIYVLINLDHLFDAPHLFAARDPGTEDLSSGIMVIEPMEGTLQQLMDVMPSVIQNKFYFGDQNIIQAWYTNWPNEKQRHLDDKYNAYIGYLNYFIANGYTFRRNEKTDLAIAHFLGASKPWMKTKEQLLQQIEEYQTAGNEVGAIVTEEYLQTLKKIMPSVF